MRLGLRGCWPVPVDARREQRALHVINTPVARITAMGVRFEEDAECIGIQYHYRTTTGSEAVSALKSFNLSGLSDFNGLPNPSIGRTGGGGKAATIPTRDPSSLPSVILTTSDSYLKISLTLSRTC
jgi:hypothetical protein